MEFGRRKNSYSRIRWTEIQEQRFEGHIAEEKTTKNDTVRLGTEGAML